jgi:hypothetical protein
MVALENVVNIVLLSSSDLHTEQFLMGVTIPCDSGATMSADVCLHSGISLKDYCIWVFTIK